MDDSQLFIDFDTVVDNYFVAKRRSTLAHDVCVRLSYRIQDTTEKYGKILVKLDEMPSQPRTKESIPDIRLEMKNAH